MTFFQPEAVLPFKRAKTMEICLRDESFCDKLTVLLKSKMSGVSSNSKLASMRVRTCIGKKLRKNHCWGGLNG